MEYWDLYDYRGKKKNKKAIRGSLLDNNEYHIVVNAWIMNNEGKFLITQRSANKKMSLMWECTGGSALKGENPLIAAQRELKEELGIQVDSKKAVLIGQTRRFYNSCPDILFVWLFKENIPIDKITIQEEEVNDVKWATRDEIIKLYKEGKFEATTFFNKVVNYNDDAKKYYIGFNANNAICNEEFLDGAITLNPNNEKGNIYYTKSVVEKRDEKFMIQYKKYILDNMDRISKTNKNVIFLAFNKKIKDLLADNKKHNIIGESNYDLIDRLNDKKYTRELLKGKVPVIDTKYVEKCFDYEDAKKIAQGNKIVLQGKVGSGGTNTYYVDSKEKFDKYSLLCNGNFFVSKYIKNLPVNSTLIVGKTSNVKLPSSVQLIQLEDDSFKYKGADFIYFQKINEEVKRKIDNYNNIIVNLLSNLGYKGILGIDYIIDEKNNVYFMEVNPRFQSSSFIISQYLSKYCSTTIAELHYLAITNKHIGNIYLEKIDNSFVNCYNKKEFNEYKYSKILINGYYAKNKTSNFRKIFNYSILKHSNFEKRTIDS